MATLTAGAIPQPAVPAPAPAPVPVAIQPIPPPAKQAHSLIPVQLREAALDSPSFRASIRHLEDQVDAVEKWMEGFVKATKEFTHHLQYAEGISERFYQAAVPTFNSEAIVDPDYTLLMLNDFSSSLRLYWSQIFKSAHAAEKEFCEPISAFIRSDLKEFKEARRQYHAAFTNYENMCTRYASQSKTKEPSALREDAWQLFESRKSYLHASLAYAVKISTLRSAIDRNLITTYTHGFTTYNTAVKDLYDQHRRKADEIYRIHAWSEEMSKATKNIEEFLLKARNELEEEAVRLASPPRELMEYSVSTVASVGQLPTTSLGTGAHAGSIAISPSGKPSKQGYLHVRTTTGKPARYIWVRRWFFLKEGQFGWLIQGARVAGVEESDKIGVLLCNVKPVATEDRRFCFDVQTRNQSLLCQAETEGDLADWLRAFDLAKAAAMKEGDGTLSHAREISVPVFAEFKPANDAEGGVPGSASMQNLAIADPLAAGRASIDTGAVAGGSGVVEASPSKGQRIAAKIGLRGHSASVSAGSGSASGAAAGAGAGVVGLVASTLSAITGVTNPTPETAEEALKFEGSTLAPSTVALPPIPTQLSKSAIYAHAATGDPQNGNAPNGMMANFWGSMNWGLIPTNRIGQDASHDQHGVGKLLSGPMSAADATFEASVGTGQGVGTTGVSRRASVRSTMSGANEGTPEKSWNPIKRVGEKLVGRNRRSSSVTSDYSATDSAPVVQPPSYPPGYPAELKVQDAQFRALFPAAPKNERVLFVFRATWKPTAKQQYSGRVFVTVSAFYVYSHYMGLVMVSSTPFREVSSIQAFSGKHCDYIVLETQDSNRLEVKVYVDSAHATQRRIGLLLKNYYSEEPLDTNGIFEELVKMTSTETDHLANHRRQGGRGSVPSTDDSLDGDELDEVGVEKIRKAQGRVLRTKGEEVEVAQRGIDGRVKEVARYKLPEEPVICGCRDHLDRKEFEHIFPIPAKALFHVIFGEKSGIWQRLYKDRGVHKFEQHPWRQIPGGLSRREFKYDITYKDANSMAKVQPIVEHQTIEKEDERLCYVVEDVKRPFDLPKHDRFTTVTKFCITHEGKGKCRLVIWTGVRWEGASTAMQGTLRRSAQVGLKEMSKGIVELVMGQVKLLGPSASASKAVKIFGEVDNKHQDPAFFGTDVTGDALLASDIDPSAPRLPVAYRRTNLGLLKEDVVSGAETAVGLLATVLKKVWEFATTNNIFTAFLLVSLVVNMILSSRSTVSYWNEKRAYHLMQAVGVKPNGIMSKAVYLQDLNDLVFNSTELRSSNAGLCYAEFHVQQSHNDINGPVELDTIIDYTLPSTRAAANRLRSSRQRIGALRHDMLVSLRTINHVERTLIESEWNNFLVEETWKCKRAEKLMKDAVLARNMGKRAMTDEEMEAWLDLEKYCIDCRAEYDEGHTTEFLSLD
ncbi:SNF1-interacting protein [Saitoella coloradoensis]